MGDCRVIAEREQRKREEREERERLERMARAGIPPPRRKDERYGPLAHNPKGDEAFRLDRRVWYEQVTGKSFEGVSLAEQWQRADDLARSWRAYSDGRPQRESGETSTEQPEPESVPVFRCIECGCKPCNCPDPGEEADWGPCDDY